MKKIVLKVTVEVPDDQYWMIHLGYQKTLVLDMTMMLNVFNLFEK